MHYYRAILTLINLLGLLESFIAMDFTKIEIFAWDIDIEIEGHASLFKPTPESILTVMRWFFLSKEIFGYI